MAKSRRTFSDDRSRLAESEAHKTRREFNAQIDDLLKCQDVYELEDDYDEFDDIDTFEKIRSPLRKAL